MCFLHNGLIFEHSYLRRDHSPIDMRPSRSTNRCMDVPTGTRPYVPYVTRCVANS